MPKKRHELHLLLTIRYYYSFPLCPYLSDLIHQNWRKPQK